MSLACLIVPFDVGAFFFKPYDWNGGLDKHATGKPSVHQHVSYKIAVTWVFWHLQCFGTKADLPVKKSTGAPLFLIGDPKV